MEIEELYDHEQGEKIPRGRVTKLKFAGKAPFFDMLGKFFKAYNTSLETSGGEKLTIVNLLRRLDPLPDGLSPGARRAYGELVDPVKPAAIEDLTSANPNAPPLKAKDETDVSDRELAAIHYANRDKHKS